MYIDENHPEIAINGFRQLRVDYFTDISKGDKVVISNAFLRPENVEYTPEQRKEITRTRTVLKEAMELARQHHVAWSGLCRGEISGNPLEIARIVTRARRDRYLARKTVRDAEIRYRMAWELPILGKWWMEKREAERPAVAEVALLPEGPASARSEMKVYSLFDYVRKGGQA